MFWSSEGEVRDAWVLAAGLGDKDFSILVPHVRSYAPALAKKHCKIRRFEPLDPLYVNPGHTQDTPRSKGWEPIRLKFENMVPVYVKSRGPKIDTKSGPNIFKKIVAK